MVINGFDANLMFDRFQAADPDAGLFLSLFDLTLFIPG